MGRKGVSKRKKAKEKNPVATGSASTNGRKPGNEPEIVVEKAKTWTKDSQKR